MNFGLEIRDSKKIILRKYFAYEDFAKIDYLYKNRIGTKDIKVEFELDLLENEIVGLFNKKSYTDEEKKIIANIEKYYQRKIADNSLILYYLFSPVFNDKHTFKKLFSMIDRSVIYNKKKHYKIALREVIDEYLKTDSRNLEKAKYVMLDYLSSNYVSLEDRWLIDRVVKKVLSKDELDYYELKFLLRVLSKDSIQKCNVYLDSKVPYVEEDGNIRLNSFNSSLEVGGHALGIIVINSDRYNIKNRKVKKDKIPVLIEAVMHESFHYKQLYDYLHNNYTVESLAYFFDTYVYDDKEHYLADYPFLMIEDQAYIHGYLEMKKFYKKYLGVNKDKLYDRNIKRVETLMAYGCSTLSKENPPMLDKYIISELETVMKDNAFVILVSPFMQLFFDLDGSLKSFNELKDKCTLESFDIYYPFLTYTLDRDEDIDLDDINTIKALALMAKKEADNINKCLRGYKYFAKYYESRLSEYLDIDQNDVIRERLRRFNSYRDMINNKDIVSKLDLLINNRLLDKYLDKGRTLKGS